MALVVYCPQCRKLIPYQDGEGGVPTAVCPGCNQAFTIASEEAQTILACVRAADAKRLALDGGCMPLLPGAKRSAS